MPETVIKIENVSKLYRLGVVGATTLRDDLKRLWWKIRGKGDPFLKIGEENKLDARGDNYVWALRDINLEIKKGEVLGIIGKNGAGKSTLLKILSRITLPTTGEIKIKGRIGSLIEVGTGFHPELTGRENIYLNGSILGMNRQEINKKFDDIVDFAGVAKYIDTPVKRYSSGMRVRLGFAVAAFLEPDILVVDEVLAVGDAEFQKRAIGKMQDVSRSSGRTVLFVSHNMGSIKQLCTRAILLDKGKIKYEGNTQNTIEQYLLSAQNLESKAIISWNRNNAPGNEKIKLLEFKIIDRKGKSKLDFRQDEDILVRLKYEVLQKTAGYRFNIWLKTIYDEIAFVASSHFITKEVCEPAIYELELTVPGNFLNTRNYIVGLNCGIPGQEVIIPYTDLAEINILGLNSHGSSYTENWPGILAPKLNWKIKKV